MSCKVKRDAVAATASKRAHKSYGFFPTPLVFLAATAATAAAPPRGGLSSISCGGGSGVLMDRPPPRGAPWELVWSAYSQRPYLQKGRSHAHVKWRLCDRPRYGPMDSRATISLESEGPKDLRAIEALCFMQGAHVVHQFSTTDEHPVPIGTCNKIQASRSGGISKSNGQTRHTLASSEGRGAFARIVLTEVSANVRRKGFIREGT